MPDEIPLGPVGAWKQGLVKDMQEKTRISERERYFIHFQKITSEMFTTTKTKNNDYGGADDPFKNFREFGELGILVRMSDKFARIKTALAEKRELLVKDEVIEDTIIDLAIYTVILASWRRMKAADEQHRNSNKSMEETRSHK